MNEPRTWKPRRLETLISEDRLNVIGCLSWAVRDLSGAAMEVGVYRGGSLAEIAKIMTHKMVYGFDTFEGLPVEKSSEEELHQAGDFADTSMESVEAGLREAGIKNVQLCKGLFPGTGGMVESICFAHLDVDFGMAMKECLEWVAPKLVKGGIVVIDDYGWEHCPQIKPVVDEFVSRSGWDFFSFVPYQCAIKKMS